MSSAAQESGRAPAVFGWPWYPFVAAIYPLWFVYFGNPGQVSAISAVQATVVMLAVVATLLWVVFRLAPSRDVGALALTVVILGFYGYGPIHDLTMRLSANAAVPELLSWFFTLLTSHKVLTPLMLALCAWFVFLVVRRVAPDSPRLSRACNFMVTALAAIMLVNFAVTSWQERHLRTDPASGGVADGRMVSTLGYNPDVYYIIVDGYARADVLRDYYGFDNSEFLGSLEQRGFKVNESSRVNYNWTFLSLASSLNYAYLQDIAAPVLSDPKLVKARNGYDAVARLVQDNRAARFLRARGYRFVHLQSSTPPTMWNEYADEQIACVGSLFDDEYFRTVAEMSWVRAGGELASSDLAECHNQRLASLADQARRPGPKFVFAHFLPPHHPYLFDRDGNVLKRVTVSNQFDFQARLWEDRDAYLEQLIYSNRSLLKVIDRILAESAQPPVIIVQSDHGPNLHNGLSPDEVVSLRLANFAAYLLPGAANVMPGDCAPVNQFRYLFNHYFDAGLEILPSRSYFSEYATPLRMREVVSKVPPGKTS